MAPTNLSVLTRSHKVASLKKRAKREQIKEVVFDDDARREFLTGFHKRKLAKKEAAKKKAVEREKQQRREQRLEQRRALAEQAVSNAREVEKAYGGVVDEEDSADDFTGIHSGDSDNEREEEYAGAELTAHVTIVEEFDPSDIHGVGPGSGAHPDCGDKNEDEDGEGAPVPPPESRRRTPSRPPRSQPAPKKGKKDPKKVKYQTSAARKAEERKQKRRKGEKAERARGRDKSKGRKGKR